MRNFFRSECAALFVGPAPAYGHHIDLGTPKVERIAKVQSLSYGFVVNREEIKQIGDQDLLTRKINITQAQPAPGSNIDVNIEPVPVDFSFEYLPTCGLNEYFLNFNVILPDEEVKNSFVSRNVFDQNFFLVLRNDPGKEARFLQTDEDYKNHFVMGFGNAFPISYNVNASVGGLVRAAVGYQASNVTVEKYKGDNYIPAIDLSIGKYRETFKYVFKEDEQFNEVKEKGLATNHIKIEIKELNVGGVSVSGENANATSFDINLDLPRRNLYGFGSMYPTDRKLNFPCMGSLNLGIIKKNILEGNLNNILKVDQPYDIKIDCYSPCVTYGCEDVGNYKLLTYLIDNAVLKSQGSNWGMHDHSVVDLQFEFTLTRNNGFAIQSHCLEAEAAPDANSSYEEALQVIANRQVPFSPTPTPTVTPTITISPTITPSITVSPTITPSITVSPTVTPSITVSPSNSPPPVTPSVTVTPTMTVTPTPTITPSPSFVNRSFAVSFQTTSTYVVEGESADVRVYRSDENGIPLYNGPFDLYYSVDTGPKSAVSGIDFIGKTGMLSFEEGEFVKPITVDTIDDYVFEHSEYFIIKIDTPVVNNISSKIWGEDTYSVLILDNDNLIKDNAKQYVRFGYQSTYVNEGDTALIKVYRDTALSLQPHSAFSVNYRTIDSNSAIAGADYIETQGVLNFAEGETEKTIEIETIPKPADITHREDEEFAYVELFDAYGDSAEVDIIGNNPYSFLIVEPPEN